MNLAKTIELNAKIASKILNRVVADNGKSEMSSQNTNPRYIFLSA